MDWQKNIATTCDDKIMPIRCSSRIKYQHINIAQEPQEDATQLQLIQFKNRLKHSFTLLLQLLDL